MLTLNDGRAELWQWDTGRTLTVDADCSQVHFSNKVFGRSIDVDVTDGAAIIPDILLQTDKDLNVWAFVGTAENGYTKISKTFKVNRRNKPSDYVFTPTEQTTLAELVDRLDKIEESQDPDAIKNAVEDYIEQNPVEVPVQSVNGQTGEVELTANDVGAISQEDLQEATNDALAQAKASGEFDGTDGITPHIGDNGNWYLGEADTGKPSRGEPGQDGADGKDGADGQPGAEGRDGIGIQSVEQTTTSSEDGGTNIVTVTTTDGTSYTFSVKNGSKGSTGPAGADGAPGAAGVDGYTPVKGTDYFTEADKREIAEAAAEIVSIPDALPNPNALTFTGAVTGSYDGSAPVTVEIPSGGGGSSVSANIEKVYSWTADGTVQSNLDSLAIEANKLYFCELLAPSDGSMSAGSVATPVVYVRIGTSGNTYTGCIVGYITGQQKYIDLFSKYTFFVDSGNIHVILDRVQNSQNVPTICKYTEDKVYIYSATSGTAIIAGTTVNIYKMG